MKPKFQYYYHGTSADNLQSILRYGLSTAEAKIWSCSSEEIYLWSADRLYELGECDKKYKNEMAFSRAFESAQIACAKAKDCRCVVIELKLPSNEVYKDISCPNMENSGAMCIGRDIELAEIISIKISSDLSLLRAHFINFIIDRDYCNIEFTDMERKISSFMKNAEIYPEDIDDMVTWDLVNAPSFA